MINWNFSLTYYDYSVQNKFVSASPCDSASTYGTNYYFLVYVDYPGTFTVTVDVTSMDCSSTVNIYSGTSEYALNYGQYLIYSYAVSSIDYYLFGLYVEDGNYYSDDVMLYMGYGYTPDIYSYNLRDGNAVYYNQSCSSSYPSYLYTMAYCQSTQCNFTLSAYSSFSYYYCPQSLSVGGYTYQNLPTTSTGDYYFTYSVSLSSNYDTYISLYSATNGYIWVSTDSQYSIATYAAASDNSYVTYYASQNYYNYGTLYVLVRSRSSFSIYTSQSYSNSPPTYSPYVSPSYYLSATCTYTQKAYKGYCSGDIVSSSKAKIGAGNCIYVGYDYTSGYSSYTYAKFQCDSAGTVTVTRCSDSSCTSCISPTSLSGCQSSQLLIPNRNSYNYYYYYNYYTYSCTCGAGSIPTSIFVMVVAVVGLFFTL